MCNRHDHGIGCTVLYPDGRMMLVDGQWDSVETAEHTVGEHHTRIYATAHPTIDPELAHEFHYYRHRRINQMRSLMDAARAVGVGPSELSSWERGVAEPTPKQRAAWVEWLEAGNDD